MFFLVVLSNGVFYEMYHGDYMVSFSSIINIFYNFTNTHSYYEKMKLITKNAQHFAAIKKMAA